MEKKTTISISQIFLALLQIAFIVLKLCKVIKWSWWLVLVPLWFYLLFFIIAIVILIIAAVVE